MPTIEQARAWYTDEDPVHDFGHILRVYRMAERLAEEEQADVEIVRTAALLHDVKGAESEGGDAGRVDHHNQSAAFARAVLQEEGWEEERIFAVEHCIRAHRFRNHSEAPKTIEAKVLFDADKLDVLGAIGVVRTVAFDVMAGEPIFVEPSERFVETGEKEPGERHSSYHEYLFKLRHVKDRVYTETGYKIAESRHRFLETFFDRLKAEMRGDK